MDAQAVWSREARGFFYSSRHSATGIFIFLFVLMHLADANAQILRRPPAQPRGSAGSNAPKHYVQSAHFVVNAPDPVLARKVAEEAERFRKELAIDWLGHEIAEWDDKCPITVELSMHAGGETSFAFVTDHRQQSRPRSWEMKIFGSPERILDSVLPHEVTHTIFATHFGQPLPRWADEGACTIVEHDSERRKNHQMLIDFLHTNRGIPFNRMFEMKQYPNDILPLYAQGHSLSKFLVMQKGKRHFLDFIAAGMKAEQQGPLLRGWDRTTEEFYGFGNLSELQDAWIVWVKSGSKELSPGELLANNPSQPSTTSTRPRRIEKQIPAQQVANADPKTLIMEREEINAQSVDRSEIARVQPNQPSRTFQDGTEVASNSWYVRQSQANRATTQRQPLNESPSAQSTGDGGNMSFQPLEALSGNPLGQSAEKTSSTIWR